MLNITYLYGKGPLSAEEFAVFLECGQAVHSSFAGNTKALV
jgi:hypothetical protein